MLGRTLVSGNVRFMWIFAGLSAEEASNDTGWSRTAIFLVLSVSVQANVIMQYYLVHHLISTDPKTDDLE